MGKPRVKVIKQEDNYFYGRYKGFDILLEREGEEDWYIMVYNDNGHLYDGWFNDSEDLPVGDALIEALDGSQLYKRATDGQA